MNSEGYLALEERVSDFIKQDAPCDEAFNELALEIFRFQRTHNSPYRKFCEQAGVDEQISDWGRIPAVPQSAFKHAALRSFPAEQTVVTFRTSGTTGEGLGEHHFHSTRLYDEAILRGWDALGLPRLRQAVFALPPTDAPHSSLSHMAGVLKKRAGNDVQHFCLEKNGALHVDALGGVEPVLVFGTALALSKLAERGERFALLPGSLVMETGGYKGSRRQMTKPELYGLLEECLGVRADDILNEYGMTELSSQFYSRGLGEVHHGAPWTRALVIDPETEREADMDKTGVLRIFDLANLGSVIAIQTRDLAVRKSAGFELLGRDPAALPRGCSRAAEEMLDQRIA